MTNNRLVLIDGHAILHRAYHAYPVSLKTREGQLTNAVYGFTRILLNTFEKISPNCAAVAFDLPKPTFRHKKFKDYKAHRPKIDDELKAQIPLAHQVVKSLNLPIFEEEGYEADDVIGSLAKQASIDKQSVGNIDVIIVTGDKDALQLIDEHIRVFMPGRGKRPDRVYDRKRFIEEYGFEPRLLIDYKALCGDASDGIPGVKGIGPVTAKRLIGKYGSVEEIYKQGLGVELNKVEASSDKITAKMKLLNTDSVIGDTKGSEINRNTKKKLLQGISSVRMSKELAEIVIDIKLDVDLSKCNIFNYDKQKIEELFEKLEFKSLMDRLPYESKESNSKPTKPQDEQMGLF